AAEGHARGGSRQAQRAGARVHKRHVLPSRRGEDLRLRLGLSSRGRGLGGPAAARGRLRLSRGAPRPPLRGGQGDRAGDRDDARGGHGGPPRDGAAQRHDGRRPRPAHGHPRRQKDAIPGPAPRRRRPERRDHRGAQAGRPGGQGAGRPPLHLDGEAPAAGHPRPETQQPQQATRGRGAPAGARSGRRRGPYARPDGRRRHLQRDQLLCCQARGGLDLDRPLQPQRHHAPDGGRALQGRRDTRLRAPLLPHRGLRRRRGVRHRYLRRPDPRHRGGRENHRLGGHGPDDPPPEQPLHRGRCALGLRGL
ncbi:MAG: aminotransferase, class IV, partial [uncultured Rubrobacteraceae bacterium]